MNLKITAHLASKVIIQKQKQEQYKQLKYYIERGGDVAVDTLNTQSKLRSIENVLSSLHLYEYGNIRHGN